MSEIKYAINKPECQIDILLSFIKIHIYWLSWNLALDTHYVTHSQDSEGQGGAGSSVYDLTKIND